MKSSLKWVSIILVIVVFVVFSGGYWFVHRSIAPVQGTFQIDEVTEQVQIYRDEWGIPHIYANSLEDVFFAQGYAQAQDRLFEMDLSRRAVMGRLSEVLGNDLLETDKFFLAVGFYRAAEKGEPILSDSGKRYLQRYADGVNAFIAENKGKLPLEFTLLGYEPNPWVVSDSLAIGKYMSWVLGGNMQTELLLMAMSEKLGDEKAREIFPSYPDEGITIMKSYWQEEGIGQLESEKLLSILDLGDRGSLGVPGVGLGSNNWVVSGKMTKSGKPILANDMHLEIKAPSIWYQNHLKVEDKLNITGVIFPGIPGVIVGHNDYIAWGVTNLNPDVQDLYIEKRNPDNPNQYMYKGNWEQAEVISYKIPVKGEDSVPFEVEITRHGPIISEVFDQDKSVPLALQWTNHLPTSELDAVIQMDQATNWEEFKKSLENFKVPTQNFVYADVKGNIAYRGNGLIPIRSKGNGLLPVPGWNGDYEWNGYIPNEELPTILNPDQGFIVTANNKVVDEAYPYFLSYEWAPPYRATAITEALKGRMDLTVEDVVAVQTNWDNIQARNLSTMLTSALNTREWNEIETDAKNIFLDWLNNSPQDRPDEAGPAIYHTFYLQLLRNTFADELSGELYDQYLSHGNAINTLDRFLVEDSIWFDNVLTDRTEKREDVVIQSFQDTVSQLVDQLGTNLEKWRWDQLHTVTFDHPLGAKKGLDYILNSGPFSVGGSSITAGAASYPLIAPFKVTSAGPWRFGVDLGNLNEGLDILFGGSSGHPFSDHYDDQINRWLNGTYKTMWFRDEDIKNATNSRITILNP